jgi:hypothetical protein
MKQNKFGELIFNNDDLLNIIMQGQDLTMLDGLIVDDTVNLTGWNNFAESMPKLQPQQLRTCSTAEWHAQQQHNWHMPTEYANMDIAAHVLGLCNSQDELQRCGQELLLYQERDLFDLLRYLKYLVDTMIANQIIWGVGRGSSVASFVLYKLQVHRIDSIHYNLDVQEFLR